MKPIIICLSMAACFAQQPEFEVATVKPSAPQQMGRMMMGMRGGPGSDDPSRYSCSNCSLMMLLTEAYGVQRNQISGPHLLDSEHFDIAAKVPPGTTKEQFRQMIQSLLAERFHLKLHRETKEMPIYELEVAKGGPKLKESAAAPPDSASPAPGQPLRSDKDGYPMLPHGRGSIMAMAPGRARLQGEQETMDQLAARLSMMVGRTVKNGTGLTGKYDFVLSFAPDLSMMNIGMPKPPPDADGRGPGPAAPSSDDSAPSIFTALQEQLGLKLEQKKGPVDLLVIDHVEKTPVEN
jgi:uncharacterized protein (TIGR03435 family)